MTTDAVREALEAGERAVWDSIPANRDRTYEPPEPALRAVFRAFAAGFCRRLAEGPTEEMVEAGARAWWDKAAGAAHENVARAILEGALLTVAERVEQHQETRDG